MGLFGSTTATAFPWSYGGRLVDATSTPIVGPVNLSAAFFATPAGGPTLATKTLSNVALVDGVFQFTVEFDDADVKQIFADTASPVYVQVTDTTHTKTYPRGLGRFIRVNSRNSTRTCSHCGSLTGPQGLADLVIRQWDCGACGAHHDRDINAAVNTLLSGIGCAIKVLRDITKIIEVSNHDNIRLKK